jgi:hypothetical protein
MKTVPWPSDTARLNVASLLETRLLIQANSGAGKSWALRRLLEQTAPDVQQLVVDSEGEFSTLRQSFDYIIAAPHDADAVASPKTAALLARRLLESGVSAILDIYDLKAHERQQFVRRFLDALINAPRSLWHPVMVVLDEAHTFCPQSGSAEAASAVIDLATRGRKRGQCLVLATQRLSKLHKDAAAEMLNKLVGRTGLDVDVKRAADELGMTAREATEQLRSLAPGEFFAYGPALTSSVSKLTIGPVLTAHPKSGHRLMQAPPAPSKRVRESLAKLADLQQQADEEATTLVQVSEQLAHVRRKLVVAERQAAQAGIPEAEVQKRIQKALAEAKRDAMPAPAPGVDPRVLATLGPLARQILAVVEGAEQGQPVPARRAREVTVRAAGPQRETASVQGLRAGAVRILQELGARAPAGYSRAQVGTLTKFAPKGGTFLTYIGDLRRAGYIEERNGLLYATDAGVESLGDKLPSAPTSHAEAMAQWSSALRAGAYRMLEAIVAAGANGIERAAIASAVDMEPRGGTFNTYLGDLRRNGLIIERDGRAIANDVLFPGGKA